MRFVLLGLTLVLASCTCNDGSGASGVSRAKGKKAKGKRKGKGKKAKGKKGPVKKVPAKLVFVDQRKLDAGDPDPYVVVDREIGDKNPPRNALWVLFKGPNDDEVDRHLRLVTSGATGFKDLKVEDGVARLKIKGACKHGNKDVTVFDHIARTLKQFDTINHVKVYDAEGETTDPEGKSDSKPACLVKN